MKYVCRLSYKCIYDLIDMYTRNVTSFNIRPTRDERMWRGQNSNPAEKQELNLLDRIGLIEGTQYNNDYDICRLTRLGRKFVTTKVAVAMFGHAKQSVSKSELESFLDSNMKFANGTRFSQHSSAVTSRNNAITKLCDIVYPEDAMQWDKFAAKISVLYNLLGQKSHRK